MAFQKNYNRINPNDEAENVSLREPFVGEDDILSSSPVRQPPKHAFQLRMRGFVNSVFNAEHQQSEQETNQQITNIVDTSVPPGNSSSNDHGRQSRIHSFRTNVVPESHRLWGKSYASMTSSSRFWLRSVPLSVLIGCSVGALSTIFLFLIAYFEEDRKSTLWTSLHNSNKLFVLIGTLQNHPFWIALIGGIVIGFMAIFKTLVLKESIVSVHSLFYILLRSADEGQDATIAPAMYSILTSFFCLISGAPLGPELAIMQLAILVPNVVSKVNESLCHGCQTHEKNRTDFFLQKHGERIYSQTSVSAGISSLLYLIGYSLTRNESIDNGLYSPILVLGCLFVYECNQIINPETTLASQILRNSKIKSLADIQEDHQACLNHGAGTIHTTAQVGIGSLDDPAYESAIASPAPVVITTPRSSRHNTNEPFNASTGISTGQVPWVNFKTYEHDLFEILTLQVISTTAAILVIRAMINAAQYSTTRVESIGDSVDNHSYSNARASYLSELAFTSKEQDLGNDTDTVIGSFQLAAGVPIGIFCGFICTIIVTGLELCRTARAMIVRYFSTDNRISYAFAILIFPIAASVLHGILTKYVTPHNSGTGLILFQTVFDAMKNRKELRSYQVMDLSEGGSSVDSSASLLDLLEESKIMWITTAIVRAISLVLTLGLGGFVGGSVLPLCTIGLCVGVPLGSAFDNIPISLTIPCCVAAFAAATCPLPFTITFATMSFMLLASHEASFDMIGPIFISCISAWIVTGGTGLLRSIERMCGEKYSTNDATTATRLLSTFDEDVYIGYDNDDNNTDNQSTNDFIRNISDDELLRDVRSTIFGSG